MTHREALDRWEPEALALQPGDYKLSQPVFVLVGEATDLATQARRHWQTKYSKGAKKQIVVRGLDLAGKGLSKDIADEIESISDALQQANVSYTFQAGRSSRGAIMAAAQELVSEIQSVLEWQFANDGKQDENDQKLANLQAEHDADPGTPDALAVELLDYAALADEVRNEIDGLGGFDASDIDHAAEVAAQLRALPPDPSVSPNREAIAQALELRNRVGFLLTSRMNLVRSAARFVFRDQPEVVRLFTSTYERKKRAASRRAKKQAIDAAKGGQPAGEGKAKGG